MRSRLPRSDSGAEMDLISIVLAVAFFALMLALIEGLDRL